MGDETAFALASSLAFGVALKLRSVNLGGCRALSDSGLAAIGAALRSSTSLTSLSLQACSGFGDEGVIAIAEGLAASDEDGSQSSLQSLDLSWCASA